MIFALRQEPTRDPMKIGPRRPCAVRYGVGKGHTHGDVESTGAAPVPWAMIIGAGVAVATLLLSVALLTWFSTRPLTPTGPVQRLDEPIVDCCLVMP